MTDHQTNTTSHRSFEYSGDYQRPVVAEADSPSLGLVKFRVSASEQLGAGDALLDDHAGDSDHGQSAIVELLGLHLGQLGRVGRLEACESESRSNDRRLSGGKPEKLASRRGDAPSGSKP